MTTDFYNNVQWASATIGAYQQDLDRLEAINKELKTEHWSRLYEYPWALVNGDFKKGQWVLDAAGGDGPLQAMIARTGAQVINVDGDANAFERFKGDGRGILFAKGRLEALSCFQDGAFDRVVCVSVLEHCIDYGIILQELWRVLKPGGRLLLTFDVADYTRWNHTIDEKVAERILSIFRLALPSKPEDILGVSIAEIERSETDPTDVLLHVICAWVEKAVQIV